MSSQPNNQIEKDREEVEALNRRLLEKDRKRTHDSSSGTTTNVDLDISKMSDERKRSLVPELREVSRQVYLEKRRKQQMELLQKEIEDEEMVFSDSEITDQEKRQREQKRVKFVFVPDV